MSDSILSVFMDAVKPVDEASLAGALAALNVSADRAPDLKGQDLAGYLARESESGGASSWLPRITLRDEVYVDVRLYKNLRGASGSLITLETPFRSIPSPQDDAEGCRASDYERWLGLLFGELTLTYGYTCAQSTAPPWNYVSHFKGEPDNGLAFELEALRRGRILQLRDLNYFSDAFLGRFPKLLDRLEQVRVASLPNRCRLVALSECLVWGERRPPDMFSLDAGIDLCWQATGSLDAHVAHCPSGRFS